MAIAAVAAPGIVLADKAAAELIDTGGAVIGMATFEQTPHGVLMYVEVEGLPPGPHGIHLHAVLVSVADGDRPALLDGDGSAVIIHENSDDHLTQPIGGAGGRIACGVILRSSS